MTPRNSQNSSKWFPFTILLAFALLMTVLYRTKQRVPAFPKLPTGGYVGQIKGLPLGNTSQSTLYVEQLEGSSSLLVVVFIDGWLPQTVALPPVSEGSPQLAPLRLQFDTVELEFTGVERSEDFGGEVLELNSRRKGRWELRAVPSALLRRKFTVRQEPETVEWLLAQTENLTTLRTQRDLESDNIKNREKLDLLSKLLKSEGALKERSAARRGALLVQTTQLEATSKTLSTAIDDLIGELALQSRLSRTGKAVTLARNIATRERAWYFANWGSAEDPETAEEFLAERENVDLKAVNAAYKRVKELMTLEQERATEKGRIEQLREQAASSAPSASAVAASTEQTEELPPAAVEPSIAVPKLQRDMSIEAPLPPAKSGSSAQDTWSQRLWQ